MMDVFTYGDSMADQSPRTVIAYAHDIAKVLNLDITNIQEKDALKVQLLGAMVNASSLDFIATQLHCLNETLKSTNGVLEQISNELWCKIIDEHILKK